MYRERDHGISERGRDQAEMLRKRIAETSTCSDSDGEEDGRPGGGLEEEARPQGTEIEWAERFRSPGVVFVSPLTRALQTAVIALKDVIQTGESELVCMRAAREKKNLGGHDSAGVAVGDDIRMRLQSELASLYSVKEQVPGARCPTKRWPVLKHTKSTVERTERRKSLMQHVEPLKLDVGDVQDRWWDRVVEAPADFQQRLTEFMGQVRCCGHEHVVVIGHSHFFRSVFGTFTPDRVYGMRRRGPEQRERGATAPAGFDGHAGGVLSPRPSETRVAEASSKVLGGAGRDWDLVSLLQHELLPNCGVVGLRLEWDGDGSWIEEAVPLFGTASALGFRASQRRVSDPVVSRTREQSPGPTLKEGLLEKRSPTLLKGWQPRVFRLHARALLWATPAPQGWLPREGQCIWLDSVTSWSRRDRKLDLVVGARTYKIRAISIDVAEEWELALREALDAYAAAEMDLSRSVSEPMARRSGRP